MSRSPEAPASLVAAQNAQESSSTSGDPLATAVTQASATSTRAQATGTAFPTATAQVATQESALSSNSTSAQSCVLRCGKCCYPGCCRRYSDSNGNGLCDQGECA